MILSRLTSHLRLNRRAAVRDLSAHFDVSEDAMKSMLGTLERKGRVRRLPPETKCGGGCSKCEPKTVVMYEWIGPG